MNNNWNLAKFGLMLLALPLVATAAASAHLQIVQSSPITVGTEVYTASVATVRLDRVHTVALNRNGGVDGRIVGFQADSTVKGLSELKVRFVKDGRTISQGSTNADGVFSAQNIPEGIYSFIASGENGFAAYSVRVVSDTTGTYDDSMEAVAVSQVDAVKQIIVNQPVSTSTLSANEKAQMDEKGANRVVLKNGTLTGNVLSPKTGKIENTQVHILKDGTLVAQVMADENGKYQVLDLKPGVYAMVAVGPQGIAAVSFEAIEFDSQTSNSAGTITYVSTAEPQDDAQPIYTDVLNVYTIGPQDQTETAQQPVIDDSGFLPIEYAGENVVYGGTGGSFGGPPVQTFSGGGGGGGGIGGGGRLLAIAGIAIGSVALGTSNPPVESNANPN